VTVEDNSISLVFQVLCNISLWYYVPKNLVWMKIFYSFCVDGITLFAEMRGLFTRADEEKRLF
jgi:hypothetical protein